MNLNINVPKYSENTDKQLETSDVYDRYIDVTAPNGLIYYMI